MVDYSLKIVHHFFSKTNVMNTIKILRNSETSLKAAPSSKVEFLIIL